MKNQRNKKLTNDEKELSSIVETIIDTEAIIKIIEDHYYKNSMQNIDNTDVNINHL